MSTLHRHPGRGFTLLEVMLAAALGAMVLIAAMGMFTALDREQARQKLVVRETMELSRTQEAMERAMQLLILSEGGQATPRAGGTTSTSGAGGTGNGGGSAAGADASKSGSGSGSSSPTRGSSGGSSSGGNAAGASGDSTSGSGSDSRGAASGVQTASTGGERPRLILEADPAQAAIMTDMHGRMVSPQRLEVAVLAPPAFAKAPEGLSAALAERRARRSASYYGSGSSRRDRESSSRTSSTTDTPASSSTSLSGAPATDGTTPAPAAPATTWRIADGVRGAFELISETPAKGQEKPSWSLVWRPIASAMTADVPDPTAESRPSDDEPEERRSRVFNPAARDAERYEPDVDLGRAVLATGLTQCLWEVYRGRSFIDHYQVGKSDELPAYVRMTVETLSGTRVEWVFEVGWVNGPEPGTVIRSTPGGVVGGATADTAQPATGTSGQPAPGKNDNAPTPGRPPTGTGVGAPSQPVRPMSPARPSNPQPAPPPSAGSPKPAAPSKGVGASPKPGT